MKQCKCGSWAMNLDVDECDVCYWKNKYESIKETMIPENRITSEQLTKELKEMADQYGDIHGSKISEYIFKKGWIK